ncbi:alpha-glucosidase/alpha-galactosidase [Paenibacillus montanisoli]|uniref:Alpha-glucosidase/alpha-galactosidase n=1 Tax=Paenibacillus montanisoli TaxID=2081970 RepID=A0A328UDJ8_9BACL|nr:alpha-glucosidase/alpha-galactosidase [Paenibacillus montanisoli]RAP78414.1 alpha-glucosidase/alpha-galactosidase [Paenibacillus montanisoli]
MFKITFIGAGSLTFTRNFLSDLMTYPEFDGSEICLMDIDEKKLGMMDALARKMIAQESLNMRVHSTTDRREALRNADYVIITIQVGGLDAFALDIEIPRKHGVLQCVGDTMGPGGVFRGLRHLSVISEIYKELEEVSPDALVLQYSNPMGIICRAVAASSSIRTVGLCHSVQGTSEQLAQFIGAPYGEIDYWVAGINHMAWFLEFNWNSKDAYPLLRQSYNDPEIYGMEPVRFDLMKHFGYFVTESSGHASEYYPYFRKRQEQIDELVTKFTHPSTDWYGFGRTAGALDYTRNERVADYYQFFEKQLAPDANIPICRSNEYGVRIIHAIETNSLLRINGNVTNNGSIFNLPKEACVEVPCIVDASGIRPCIVGELPVQLAALNQTNLNVQELAVQGFLHRDKSLIYQAVKLDPLAGAACTLEQIDSLVTEMFESQAEWLPQFKS